MDIDENTRSTFQLNIIDVIEIWWLWSELVVMFKKPAWDDLMTLTVL